MTDINDDSVTSESVAFGDNKPGAQSNIRDGAQSNLRVVFDRRFVMVLSRIFVVLFDRKFVMVLNRTFVVVFDRRFVSANN